MRARSNRACHVRELNNTGMHTLLVHVHGRARLDQGVLFFAYILLIIEFKGIVMKLKNVPHTISVEKHILQFYSFTVFTFHSLVIRLQTLLGQTSHMPWVKGLSAKVMAPRFKPFKLTGM